MKNKLLVIILAFVLCFSAFAGCGGTGTGTGGGNSGGSSSGGNSGNEVGTIVHQYSNANHDLTIVTKDSYFIQNGSSDYKVILAENATKFDVTAASELTSFLKEATGVMLDIITENEQTVITNESKYIFIGDTVAAQSLNIDYSAKTIKGDGFKFVTKDNNIILVGGGKQGTIFGVYEMLYHYIGWDVIATDEIIFDTTSNVRFKSIDGVEIPDFEYRIVGTQTAYDDDLKAQRFRQQRAYTYGFMVVNGRLYHNAFCYLDPTVYNDADIAETYHPDWYAIADDQTSIGGKNNLCYTAHGSPSEYELMQEKCLEVLVQTILANPDIDSVQLSQEDNTDWCSCDDCAASMQEYGTGSAVVIQFCNDLHTKLEAYLEANNINRKINLVFFAYHATEKAPAVKGADGNFKPIDDSVKCKDGVYVFYAAIYANYYEALTHESNANYYDQLKAWSVVSNKLYFWAYSTNYRNYLIPYACYGATQDNYKLAKQFGVEYMFDEGQHYGSTPKPGGFSALKEYMQSKLQWNVEADVPAMIDKFFTHYFGPASQAMRKYFDELNANTHYMTKVLKISGVVYEDVLDEKYWNAGMLKNWIEYIDEAYEAIEGLQNTDNEKYRRIKDRILIESIAPRYLYLVLHLDADKSYETEQMRKQFKTDIEYLGFTEQGQGTDISGLWTQWGIA